MHQNGAGASMVYNGHTGRLAVRQGDAVIPNRLTEILEMPAIATSANRSGQAKCRSCFEVLGVMGGRVALVFDAGAVAGTGATTVDITDPDWKMIRAGAISEAAIRTALQPQPHFRPATGKIGS